MEVIRLSQGLSCDPWVMMLMMLYKMPSALMLYWSTSQIVAIVQLYWQRHRQHQKDAAEADAVEIGFDEAAVTVAAEVIGTICSTTDVAFSAGTPVASTVAIVSVAIGTGVAMSSAGGDVGIWAPTPGCAHAANTSIDIAANAPASRFN